jgi:NADH-quinone oxidoreductase subunit J
MVELFYLFASLAIISAILVISSNNPIHSVLFLILVFCNVSGILIMLGVEFMAMMFLIVYVGAIAVLFLFVVMMLNVKMTDYKETLTRYLPVGSIMGLIFLFEVFLIMEIFPQDQLKTSSLENVNNSELIPNIETFTNIEVIGNVMYTDYFYLFLISGMILLVSMIGAIVLTLHRRGDVKRQQIYMQVQRDFEHAIKLYDSKL